VNSNAFVKIPAAKKGRGGTMICVACLLRKRQNGGPKGEKRGEKKTKPSAPNTDDPGLVRRKTVTSKKQHHQVAPEKGMERERSKSVSGEKTQQGRKRETTSDLHRRPRAVLILGVGGETWMSA